MNDGIVVAGGGLAGQRFCARLRSRGYDGRIRLVCEEDVPPYDRPPLSKAFLLGDAGDDELQLRPPHWYSEQDVDLLLGEPAERLDPSSRTLLLGSGQRLHYEQLLIATGSAPRRLQQAEGFDNVHYLRTATDARVLREALRPGAHVVVVGAGFIGQEVASSAIKSGCRVTILEALAAPLERVIGATLGEWFAQLHRSEGAEVVLGATVTEFRGDGRVQQLVLDDGRRIDCDAVVVGVGVAPASQWLAGSGLPVDGVPVDSGGRSSFPGVLAAGDVARPFDRLTGAHLKSEHWEAAVKQGIAAADTALGIAPQRRELPSFWSDLHGVRIQYLGHARGNERIEIEGDPGSRDFSAVFHRDGIPVAALLVGRPRALPEMRRLLTDTHERLIGGDLNADHANAIGAAG